MLGGGSSGGGGGVVIAVSPKPLFQKLSNPPLSAEAAAGDACEGSVGWVCSGEGWF